jgi:hypothetical protein
VTLIAFTTPVLGYTSKLTCGKPTNNGRIKVSVIMMKDDGTFGYPREVSLDVDSTWTAEDKAAFLRTEFWARIGLRDTVKALGTTAEIQFQGQNGWMVHSVNVIQDDSHEPDRIALGIPFPDQQGLCSLSGVASGRDARGGQAFVGLTVGQTTVTVPTQPGMPAQVVEQALISRLNQMGIGARYATAEDFAGCYQSLPHDESVIWFLVPDTTGFREEITDLGLALDIAAALDGSPQVPSTVHGFDGARELQLEVAPSLFSNEDVRIRYSAGAGTVDARASIDIIDVAGRRVRTLLAGAPQGAGALLWDGRSEYGTPVPGGVYFVRFASSRGSLARRVVHLRD